MSKNTEGKYSFHDASIEKELNNIFEPTVKLKSGGYLVINPTQKLILYRDGHKLWTIYKTNDASMKKELNNIFEPTVKLKSGGYLVINPTEALVANTNLQNK